MFHPSALPPTFILLTLLTIHQTLTSAHPLAASSTQGLTTAQLNHDLPPNFQLTSSNLTFNHTPTSSICTRSYWHGIWDVSLWLRNKTTPETSALGTGFFDNVNADCGGIIWPHNPTVLSEDPSTGRVTGYFVKVGVNNEPSYSGCVELAVRQAEAQNVTCVVVPSPCGAEATECQL